jgi:hypothetical protein
MKFFPAGGGTMFRLFTIPPADPNMTEVEIATMQEDFSAPSAAPPLGSIPRAIL